MEHNMDVDEDYKLKNLYTLPTSPIVIKWMRLFNEGKLTCTDFREHWRSLVPKAYPYEHNLNNVLQWAMKEEESIQELLIENLEEFICNGDKEVIFKYIINAENPPSVCGKVFKIGEPTYNCRECGMDSTCVLCVDCFQRSEHKNHKYKIRTSGGGGCCDCGDMEAWKQGPSCDKHNARLRKSDQLNHFKFPPDLIARTEILFTCILKYAFQVLNLEFSLALPNDLWARKKDSDKPLGYYDVDEHCTVLYNDETHTFEQVINTITRVIKCSQRDAIEFVTDIDREGRTVVKSSTFEHCTDLKADIEKFTSRHGTRPLKVDVVHANVIAHQLFALKLLTWLQKLCTYAEGFRSIFTRLILDTQQNNKPMIEELLQRDSFLWKSARLHWHRLFIAAMFMEYKNKKAFSLYFTKLYGTIMKDFIRDDHDHSFSVASLSIQIFTVPTLAQYLIAEADVLFILMNTFVSECSRKCNKLGKLEFDRSSPNGPFKRATYILSDLRYLLSTPPEVWTDNLRKGFLQGMSLVLTLLTYMQGMDSVTRQIGQHMEYEPEWESAFNLHLKLAPVITLLLNWCSTDKIILVKTYRLTLVKLYENPCFDKQQLGEVRELVDHSASCLQYDVSSQPVSIHLPLSRFLAGLHLHLEQYGLTFDSPEFALPTKHTPEQILEPVLRTQVMISQVHAGMWRRNGYSLANQIYFYHNVKCRGEMLDKDVIILQMCASLIESNEFLIHLLNKFNLINWVSHEFDDSPTRSSEEESLRQVINLVEEFLSLLIVIIGERYVPGVGRVTEDDCIKNEIIHQLFIRPLSHSEVNKTLPDDLFYETVMERVIKKIANFKKPSQCSGKGVYEIKEEYLDKYNVFFYHYTKEELSKSEEEQRKLRKSLNRPECCPPPVLPQLCEPFSMVANLLQCDVMLYLMHIVLERSLNLKARSFSEAQFQKVLHLIGYALHEEEQKYSSFFTFTSRAKKWDIEILLEELSSSPRVEIYKPLLRWTLNKFKKLTSPSEDTTQMEVEASDNNMSEIQEKEIRAKQVAAERRAAIMAQMAQMQQNFMKDNADLFEDSTTSFTDHNFEGGEMESSYLSEPVALGEKQSMKILQERKYTCILCQEDQLIVPDGPAMVLAAFVQKSTVLCRNRGHNRAFEDSTCLYLNSNMGPAPHASTCGHVMHSACWKKYIETIQSKENRRPYRLRQATSFDIEKNEFLCPLCECLNNTVLPVIPPLHTLPNAMTNEPVGKVSFSNWYEASTVAISHKRKTEKPSYRKDFLDGLSCLQCITSSKNDVEKFPPSTSTIPKVSTPEVVVISSSESDGDESESDCSHPFVNITDAIKIPLESEVYVQLRVFSEGSPAGNMHLKSSNSCGLSDDLLEMINLFSQLTYSKGLEMDPQEDDRAIPMMAWKTCAYTIHSLEWLLRFTNKPLFGDFTCRQQDGLENLIRLAGVLGVSWKNRNVINRHGVKLLSMIVDNDDRVNPSVLEWDCFGLLVPMTATFPTMFCSDPVPPPTGLNLELHSFYLMFLAHIAQTILYSDLSIGADRENEEDIVGPETSCLSQLIRIFRILPSINTDQVWKLFKKSSISFLRCCAIFYHFLTGIPSPECLKEVGGDTFENLCSYLGLPYTCGELLGHLYVRRILSVWSCHYKIKGLTESIILYRDIMPLNQLVTLPEDYSELINTVSLFTCPNSDREDSRNPTMCLICGEMLCSQTYCCQTELNKALVGACTYHTYKCGAGAGIFLRIRECEILLLASPNRGCFRAPPYVDDYGEADQGLRRGNPLHLCIESYRKLQLLWLSHSIHEEIARAIEFAHTLIPTQWQHL